MNSKLIASSHWPTKRRPDSQLMSVTMGRSTKMSLHLAVLAFMSCSGGGSSADFVEAGAQRSREHGEHHLDGGSKRNDHRNTKHLQPVPTAAPTTPLPTFTPTQVPMTAFAADGSAGEISSKDGHANDSANPADEGITTDSINTSSLLRAEGDGGTSKSAPIYELAHGLGVFTVASGNGCYEGAHGQAQARFGVANSNIDLFVPSVFAMLDPDVTPDSSPQDTVFNADDDDANGDGTVDQRRIPDIEGDDGILLDDDADQLGGDATPTSASRSPECDMFHSGRKSFNQISLELERGANPLSNVMSTSTSYHQHGTFKAKGEWFYGLGGEYSLSCVHHECLLSLHFGVGPLVPDDDDDGCSGETCDANAGSNGKRSATSLTLQGTTELAYQGQKTGRLICVENCENASSGHTAAIETDAEYAEGAINVRAFDNNVVQVLSSHSTKAPKAAKSSKASKAPKAAKAGKSQKNGKGAATTTLVSCSVDTDCGNGIYCDGTEACLNGVCQAGPGNPCSGGTPLCDETNDVCVECLVDGDCDDGSFCTGVETCLNGVCQAGPGNPCSGGTPVCDETNDVCVECLVDGDCDDTFSCTVDSCSTNSCIFTPVNANCDDGLFCNGSEVCNTASPSAAPVTGCVSSVNPCTSPAVCSETNDACNSCDTVFPPPSGAPSGYYCYDASDTVYTDNCGGIETVIIVNTNDADQSTHQSTTAPSLGSGFRLAEPRSAALDACYRAILSPLSNGYPGGNNFYIGATDASVEGDWVWESDSELFWTGGLTGTVVSGQYAGWDTNSQPNDFGTGEDCAEFNYFWADVAEGFWNDVPCSTARSAIYELVV